MSDENGFSDEELATWMAFVPVMDVLPAALNSQLIKFAGMPQVNLYVLARLHMRGDQSTRLSELAACSNSALPRMSRIVARLEEDGLIARSSDEGDGRAVNIELTPRGRSKLEDAMPVHDRLVRELVLDVLSREQLEQLREISQALLARLHPDMASPMDRQHIRAPLASG